MLRPLARKNYLRIALLLFVGCVFPLVYANTAQAATLSFAPSSSQVSTGNIISLKLIVGTGGVAINDVDATIDFPTDLLQVMSVSKDSSIFSLWVADPAFSNNSGTITLDGGLPNPGFSGTNGEVVSIVFRAKKPGTASIVFGDSAVRANDGNGTNVLSGTQAATIAISSAASEIPTVTTVSNSLPPAPVITSTTNPEQDTWYPGTTASFSWVVPNDVVSLETLLSKDPSKNPTVAYDPSVSQRTVNNLSDGVWYFSVRYENSVGWGPVTQYKVQIDSTPPQTFTLGVQPQGVENIVTLNAVDAMSGINSYSLRVDGSLPIVVMKNSLPANDEYVLPIENQGEHDLNVLAYDKAGNFMESDATFTSQPIVAPVVTLSILTNTAAVENVQRGDALAIQGTSEYPNSPVEVFVKTADGNTSTYFATTTEDGSFSMNSSQIEVSGQVSVWAQMVFSDSVKSPISNTVSTQVQDTAIVQASQYVTHLLLFVIPMLALIIILTFLVYLGWHKFFGLRRKLDREMVGTINDMHKALTLFKGELESQLGKLEKMKEDRELNKKEEKIFKELQSNIDNIDEFFEKKLKKLK
jgi:hypothetical protein